MANEFEEGLKDLVSEQFKDGEVAPLRDEKTGEFVKNENVDDDDGEHSERVGDRERKAADNEDGSNNDDDDEELPDDEDEDEDEDEEDDGEKEDDEDGEPDENEGKGKKPRGRFQKRVDGLTATVKRLERELRQEREGREARERAPKKADGSLYGSADEYAKDMLFRDEKAPKKPKAEAKDKDGKPLYKLGEFDEAYREDYDDYLEARRDFLAAKRGEFEKGASVSATDAAAASQQEFQTKLNSTVETGKKTYKDFDEKVVKGIEKDEWPLSEAGAHFLVDSEVGADIAYALASDVKLAKEIAALSPIAQIKRFTKLEEKFIADAAERKKSAKRQSSAPEPISGKAKGGGRRETSRFDSENFEDVERNWNQANSKQKR